MPTLQDQLRQVHVDDPREVEGLQVFGVRWETPPGPDYTILDDALEGGRFRVTEVGEQGSVPSLTVTNDGDVKVFLMAGEQLIGAKQNRVLNASLLVDAKSAIPIPVSCVEAGRWGYQSRAFRSGGSSSHAALRALMNRHAREGYRRSGAPSSDQHAVWSEVDRKLDSLRSVSPTHALQQAYDDSKHALKSMLDGLPSPEGCAGAVFAFHGRIAGMDLFDKPTTLARLWPKIVHAYALDAIEPVQGSSAPVSVEAVREWIRAASASKAESFKSPGLGEDVRLDSPGFAGAGLVVNGRPVHVEMFSERTEQKAADPEPQIPFIERRGGRL